MKLSLASVTKHLHYGKRLRPGRDWLVLLCFFLVAIAMSVAYNLFTFSQVTQGQQIGNEAATTPAQIKLDQIKALFEARSAERERYNSEYRFVDPSL